MVPASCLVGPYQTIVALQFGIPGSNARCGRKQLSCRVVKCGRRVADLKLRNERYRRSSGGYSPSRARGESAPESEDEEKVVLEVDRNSRPGLKARSLVGTYAASTALAVQESLPPEGVIVLLACLVGVLTGGSVVLFNLAVDGIHDEVWGGIPQSGAAWLRTRPLDETWIRLLAVPFGGGVLVGILNTIRQSLLDTSGSDEKIPKSEIKSTRVADVRGVCRAFLKAVGAAVTLGTGCSLGPEGPSVEIGASIANGVGTVLSNSRERKLSLVAAGSAAGISSGFNAAVAGCFFALESVLRPSSSDSAPSLTTAMLLLSSVLASVISQAGLGSDPAFKIPAYDFRSPAELPLYLLLGILCGGVSVTLVKGSAYCITMFDNVRKSTGLPAGVFPPVGGLAVGIIALAYPEILYWGFENVDVLLESRPLDHILGRGPSAELLLQLVGAKVIATSLCRGSGLVGGMYAPSLFIGAALGSAYGNIARTVFINAAPDFHLEWLKVAAPQAYALVGMAAMLAGVCQVPLTSVLLLFELTRDYRIILPLMGAVGLSSWIASSSTKKSKRSKSEVAPIPKSELGVVLEASVVYPNTPNQESNGISNGGIQANSEEGPQLLVLATDGKAEVYTKDGSPEDFVEDQDMCNVDESLCLANFEISEEQLAEEIPVSMAMRTRFAAVSLDSTVREAMSSMAFEKEWCVLILDSNRCLSGLLSLADIQQAAGNATSVNMQMEVESKPVSAILKSRRLRQVVTAREEMSLRAAQRLMAGRGLRQIPVVDGSQRVVGLLDRDSIALACRAEATRRLLGLSLSRTALKTPNESL